MSMRFLKHERYPVPTAPTTFETARITASPRLAHLAVASTTTLARQLLGRTADRTVPPCTVGPPKVRRRLGGLGGPTQPPCGSSCAADGQRAAKLRAPCEMNQNPGQRAAPNIGCFKIQRKGRGAKGSRHQLKLVRSLAYAFASRSQDVFAVRDTEASLHDLRSSYDLAALASILAVAAWHEGCVCACETCSIVARSDQASLRACVF